MHLREYGCLWMARPKVDRVACAEWRAEEHSRTLDLHATPGTYTWVCFATRLKKVPPFWGGLVRSLPYLGFLCMLSEALSIAQCPWLKKGYLLCWYVTVYACLYQTRFAGAYCVWETSKNYISPQLYLYVLNLLSDFKSRPFLKIFLFFNCTFKKGILLYFDPYQWHCTFRSLT